MIYSVWNQGSGLYDYFQTPDVQKMANAPSPGHLRAKQLGTTPSQAAWPLPVNAKRIGSGEFARGRVATVARDGLGFVDEFPGGMLGCVVAAVLAYRIWRRR